MKPAGFLTVLQVIWNSFVLSTNGCDTFRWVLNWSRLRLSINFESQSVTKFRYYVAKDYKLLNISKEPTTDPLMICAPSVLIRDENNNGWKEFQIYTSKLAPRCLSINREFLSSLTIFNRTKNVNLTSYCPDLRFFVRISQRNFTKKIKEMLFGNSRQLSTFMLFHWRQKTGFDNYF